MVASKGHPGPVAEETDQVRGIYDTIASRYDPVTASAESASPPSMMANMRGHASMADALQAHPELADTHKADMHTAGGAMTAKMQGHASMADALQAHPELADMHPSVFSS